MSIARQLGLEIEITPDQHGASVRVARSGNASMSRLRAVIVRIPAGASDQEVRRRWGDSIRDFR